MAHMKEQIKAPQKIQLCNEDITNQSDAQFKTLVIRMLTDKIEYDFKIEEKVMAMLSEIKENVQGTNSEGKETGTQSTVWSRRKNQNRMKKQEFKKMRRDSGTSRTTLNVPTSESQGCRKEKRKSKKLKTHLKI